MSPGPLNASACARLVVAVLALVLAVAAALFFAPGKASAQTCSATVTDIDFGDPDVLSGGADDAMGTVTVTCTKIPSLTVVKLCPSIEAGSGGSAGSSRLLRSSGGTLAYQLYSDASRTQGWGSLTNTDLGAVPAILLGGGVNPSATATQTIYARIFGSQSTAPPGSYLSTFGSAETSFGYSGFLLGLGANASCRGFVGAAVLRPAFVVKADERANCLVSATDVNFGTVGLLASAVRGEGNLTVTCTRGTPYQVGLDAGLNGTASGRRLSAGAGATIGYALYRDSARTQAWGQDGALRASGTGLGTGQSLAIYGEVPAQTTPGPGVYSDRIVVTITY